MGAVSKRASPAGIGVRFLTAGLALVLNAMDPEKRAPGWQIRCTRCGFTEHWGQYGVSLGAFSWKKYTIGRCCQCKRIAFHAIEKTPKAKAQ